MASYKENLNLLTPEEKTEYLSLGGGRVNSNHTEEEAFRRRLLESKARDWGDGEGMDIIANTNKTAREQFSYGGFGYDLTGKQISGDGKSYSYTKQKVNPQSSLEIKQPKVTTPIVPPTQTTEATQPQGFKLLGGNLKEGVRNENVRQLQTLLGGLNADGIYGPKTKAAVIAFQKANGLTADGIVGPATTAALNKVYGGSSSNVGLPHAGGVGSGVPGGASGGPTLPPPTSGATTESYLGSVAADLANSRKTLEDNYKKQIKDLEKKVESITKKEQDALENVEDLSDPFREDLENAERERLYINQNFEANQRLTGELESLLNEGNSMIAQMKGVTGLSGIRNPRINQAIEAVNARVGVIQAVMSARSGQIAEGYRMIDRSLDAMNADRQDQLNYYNSLLDFYGSQKADLKADQKVFLSAQIDLLQNDLARSQATADAIKEAMIDPDTALAYAEAGVTLNDTPAQIGSKLARYAYTSEVKDMSNEMALKGYTALIGGAKAPAGAEVVQTTDSKGVTKTYYTLEKAKSGSGTVSTVTKSSLIKAAEKLLNDAKGTDGYTDPYLYADAYEGYTAGYVDADGVTQPALGTSAEFLSKFPPKNYVNPKATNLPDYLQNKTKATSDRNV